MKKNFASYDQHSSFDYPKKKLLQAGVAVLILTVIAAASLFYLLKGKNYQAITKDREAKGSDIQMLISDDDGDGLMYFMELAYGTDPDNKDTDGDGYHDGEEVKKGYNPTGGGKMNEEYKTAINHYIELYRKKYLSILFGIFLDEAGGYLKAGEWEQAEMYYDILYNSMCEGDAAKEEACIQYRAVSKNDISHCNNFPYPSDRLDCIKGVAFSSMNEKFCNSLPGQISGDDASEKDYCYSAIAEYKQDLSICQKINDNYLRYSCIADLALINKDPSICKNIIDARYSGYINSTHDTYVLENCYTSIAALMKDFAICENITYDPKNPLTASTLYKCYSVIADIKNDFSYCSLIVDHQKNNFKDLAWMWDDQGEFKYNDYLDDLRECVKGVFFDFNEIGTCESISHPYTKASCQAIVADNKADERICREINNKHLIDECNLAVGIKKADMDICFTIIKENKMDSCIGHVAAIKGDISLCQHTTESGKNSCYKRVAETVGDASLCSLMQVNAVDKDKCFRTVDKYRQSCSEHYRDTCYYNVGIKNKSIEICNMVINGYDRSNCLKAIGKKR